MAQKIYLVEKESAAFKLFGVKISSFYLERPLNAKTFSDSGRTPFGTLLHGNSFVKFRVEFRLSRAS